MVVSVFSRVSRENTRTDSAISALANLIKQNRQLWRVCGIESIFSLEVQNTLLMANLPDVHRESQHNGIKRGLPNDTQNQRPVKKIKALLEEDDGSDLEQSDASNAKGSGIASIGDFPIQNNFEVNEDYARRFEHNKKREELQRRQSWFQNPS